MEKKIKVLVVDDSAFMRLLISDILSEDSGIEVIGTASDGQDAAEKVKELTPNAVVLDMNMGEYDGIYAVKKIMAENPVPILILSAVGNTDLQPIFEALNLGAVDYMNKPVRKSSNMRMVNAELIAKLKSVARAKPKVLDHPPLQPVAKPVSSVRSSISRKKSDFDLVAIGASTGGPSAIEEVITRFPANFPVPVIVCQHMPANFIQPFVNRLNGLCQLEVVVASEGMEPAPGVIMVCPGDSNMILIKEEGSGRKYTAYTEEKFSDYNHPSINALLLSVAKTYGGKSLGVILTGMGKDGAKGLKAIKEKGGYTVAQDKESSVIYGMPKVAYEMNAVKTVLGIKEIGNHIVEQV